MIQNWTILVFYSIEKSILNNHSANLQKDFKCDLAKRRINANRYKCAILLRLKYLSLLDKSLIDAICYSHKVLLILK